MSSFRRARGLPVARCAQDHDSARHFNCGRCRGLVQICRGCDRGQTYCSESCARSSRQESRRASNARYQRSPRGRRLHAARQRQYRARESKMTDHGSAETDERASVVADATARLSSVAEEDDDVHVPEAEVVVAGARHVDACATWPRPHANDTTTSVDGAPASSAWVMRADRARDAVAEPTASTCCVCGRVLGVRLRADFLRRPRRRAAQSTADARAPPRRRSPGADRRRRS